MSKLGFTVLILALYHMLVEIAERTWKLSYTYLFVSYLWGPLTYDSDKHFRECNTFVYSS